MSELSNMMKQEYILTQEVNRVCLVGQRLFVRVNRSAELTIFDCIQLRTVHIGIMCFELRSSNIMRPPLAAAIIAENMANPKE